MVTRNAQTDDTQTNERTGINLYPQFRVKVGDNIQYGNKTNSKEYARINK